MDFDKLQNRIFRLHVEGAHQAALDLVEEHAADLPEHDAVLTWYRACLLGAAGRPQAALEHLEQAISAGHWYSTERLLDDSDLASARDLPAFPRILATCQQRQHAAEQSGGTALTLHPAGAPVGTLVAFHRAANSPRRSSGHWRPACQAGWRLVLPHAPLLLGSDSAAWLRPRRDGLDFAGARQIARDQILPGLAADAPTVVAGFAQGAAVALYLALTGTLPAGLVLVVGATHRYADVVDAWPDQQVPIRLHLIAGARERHVTAATDVVSRLNAAGHQCTSDIRSDLGHRFPADFGEKLPTLLASASIHRFDS